MYDCGIIRKNLEIRIPAMKIKLTQYYSIPMTFKHRFGHNLGPPFWSTETLLRSDDKEDGFDALRKEASKRTEYDKLKLQLNKDYLNIIISTVPGQKTVKEGKSGQKLDLSGGKAS